MGSCPFWAGRVDFALVYGRFSQENTTEIAQKKKLAVFRQLSGAVVVFFADVRAQRVEELFIGLTDVNASAMNDDADGDDLPEMEVHEEEDCDERVREDDTSRGAEHQDFLGKRPIERQVIPGKRLLVVFCCHTCHLLKERCEHQETTCRVISRCDK